MSYPYSKYIAGRINLIRTGLELTEEEFGNRIGCDAKRVIELETEQSQPTAVELIWMSILAHVSSDFILSLSNELKGSGSDEQNSLEVVD